MDRLRYLPLAMGAVLAAYLAVGEAGAAGAGAVAAVAVFTLPLVLWAHRPSLTFDVVLAGRMGRGALLVVPALLTLGFGFSGGGFYPDSVAWAAIGLSVVLIVRCAVVRAPLSGAGPWVVVPGLALVLLAVWTLVSAHWSDSPGRAALQFDRLAVYALAFVIFGSLGRSARRLNTAIAGTAAAFTIIAAAAFVSRAVPDVLETSAQYRADRLSYPLGYWNALGLCCAIGLVFLLHATASAQVAKVVRVLAAGAIPLVATTLLLTYSRAGVAAAVVGVPLYIALGHSRTLLTALAAAGPPTAFALVTAYNATLLSSDDPTSPGAVAQGHHLAQVLIVCVLVALVLRALLLLAEPYLERLRLPQRARVPVLAGAAVAALLAVVAIGVAVDAPREVSARYDQFVHDASPNRTVTRERLGSTSNAGRLALWRAAIDGFHEAPLHGTGAGTYSELWMQYRTIPSFSTSAHGLYQETLGELGIVGVTLLLVALVAIVIRLVPVRRGPDRAIYAALFTAALMYAAHAAFDWDWQMPATTVWLFALGGLAAGRAKWSRTPRPLSGVGLAAIGLLTLGVAVFSGAILASQTRLDASVRAYHDGDCRRAIADARSATDALASRAEPREVAGACFAAAGRFPAAAAELKGALARDPRNWGLHYSQAAVLAADGRNPRADLRAAKRLNPTLTKDAAGVSALGARNKRTRRAAGRAIAADLPLSGRW